VRKWLAVVGVALLIVLALGGVRWWQADNESGFEEALSLTAAGAERVTYTDWAGVRSRLGADLTSDSSYDEVAGFLDEAFEADISPMSALLESAETLHEEALVRKVPVSLATVYNTLHQFTAAGLLREVAVEGAKAYFDTNTSNHYHFFCEHSGKLMDIATGSIRIEGLPEAPEGTAISRVDVLVRLVDKR